MPTIQKHSEYAPGGIVRSTSSTGTASGSDQVGLKTNNSTSSSKTKSASNVYEERFLFGAFSDFVKNTAKIMTGSLFTDLIKGVLKDKKMTWEKVLYNTLVDSGPSRFFTDYINAFAVRTFRFLPPEISSQILSMPSVIFFRACTSNYNVNATSAKNNMSEEEKVLKKQIATQPFAKVVKSLNKNFKKHFQPKLNYIFEKALGVTAAKELKDSEGNVIYGENGKALETNPKVQMRRLLTTIGAFMTGTFFLPRHTKQTGSDLVDTPIRATINTIATTLFRLNTTVLHNGVGAHIKGGANFDKCYDAAVQEKTLVPLVQYTCDNIGALLSKHIPINGAFLGILARLVGEIPSTFLSAGLVNFAEGDRLSEKWKLLGQRIWLPATKKIYSSLNSTYKFAAKNFYSKLLGGMFNPKFKNMYDVNIGLTKSIELDKDLDAKYAKGILPTFWLLSKETLGLFTEIPNLLNKCASQSDLKKASDIWTQKSVNRRLDFLKQHGFRAPTHGTETEKAQLTEEQRKRVDQIEAKELSRGFKIVWNEEKGAYMKLSAPLPSIENDGDEKVDVQDMRSYHEAPDKPRLSKEKIEEEDSTQELLLSQAA